MVGPMAPSHLTVSDLERSNTESLRFQALYLITRVAIKIYRKQYGQYGES